jgi:hypothetical protein
MACPFSPGEAGDGSLPGGLVCGTAGAWETEEIEGGRAGSGTADGARFRGGTGRRWSVEPSAPVPDPAPPLELDTLHT